MRFLLVTLLLLTSCAHRQTIDEAPPGVSVTPPSVIKTKIKYVYVKTPETVSAMTVEPYEAASAEKPALTTEIVKFFWPLLTLLGTGALLIVGLFIEHLILNRQLARRRELRQTLRA